MSIINAEGQKVLLPRMGADQFWTMVLEDYAHDSPRKWKYLAMLALRVNAGWPLGSIGRVFDHDKGHVQRCLENVKRELRTRLEACPELFVDDEPARTAA